MEDQTVQILGRQLPPEELFFGNNFSGKSEKADWGGLCSRNHVLRTVSDFLFYH